MDGPAQERNQLALIPEDVDDEMDDFEAPLAANAENKQLHKEVKKMERQVLELEAEIEANQERVSAMENHMKNVEAEVKVVQDVGVARENEVKTEERIALLAEAETKALEKDAKKMQAEIEANVGVQNQLQNQIFTLQQEMEGMREQMQWDEKQLAEWLENARLREEDADVLRKYQQADEARTKELSLELERLNQAVQKAERQLEAEVTNTRAHRLGLDKVSLLFKDAHKERTDVIEQWEGTVARMETEDKEIEAAATRFQDLKSEATKAKLKVAEQEEFLEEQITSNKDSLAVLEKQERGVVQLEEAREAAAAQADRFQSELDSLRNVVTRTSSDERQQVREFEGLVDEYAKRERRLAAAVNEVERLEAQVEANSKNVLSAEEQAAALEKQLTEEEAYTREIEKQLKAVSEKLAVVSQKNHELRTEKAALEAEANGCEQAEKNLSSRMLALERQMVHQGQLMYKQDFQAAVLERKLLKLEGTTDDGEAEAEKALKAEVDSLKETLAQHTETQKLLRTQLRRLEDEGRVAKKRRDAQAAELVSQQQRLAEIELYNQGAAKELESVINAKQNMMVDENLLKLTLRRLRKQLDSKADDVLSLEQRNQELKAAMQERIQEIEVHKELLKVQRTECNRERSRVAKELGERQVRIDQLKKRHEIVSFSMKGPQDDTAEEHSEAYMMVKAAQEREELQQKGDALDAQIRKQEKELRMLDSTLHLMNGHNAQYKDSLRRANVESSDMELKEHLEGQLRTALDKFKHKRRELHLKEQERDNQLGKQAEAEADLGSAKQELSLLHAEYHNIQRELNDQEAKLGRAQETARKIIQSFRKDAGNLAVETVAEKDFHLLDIKDFNARIFDAIDAIVEEVPDLRTKVSLFYSSNKIQRPVRRSVGGAGTRTGTSRGSVSSGASSTGTASLRGSVRGSSTSSRVASSRAPSSRATSSRATSSRAASRVTGRTLPGTSNAVAASRASVVTPKTVEFGMDLGSTSRQSSRSSSSQRR
eukprot:m.181096 g.181096  ORF g.181096 m.181096 type:complete len:1001 (+) comp15168_c0_seq1:301-3303(+)